MGDRRRQLFVLTSFFFLVALGLRSAEAQLLGPELQINTHTTDQQMYPAVAADGSGHFVVVWEAIDQDGSDWGVFGQRFESTGSKLGSEFQVNTHSTGYQVAAALAADGSGGFVAVWESYGQDGSGNGIFGQRFDPAGSKAGSEFQVNSFTTDEQLRPTVAMGAVGSFVVVWESDLQDGSTRGVFGQRFASTGSKLGSEFPVNSYTTGFQTSAAVVADGAGNFVVVWDSFDQDGSGGGVFGQRFASAGSQVGTELQVNTYTTDDQKLAAVATDGSGNFVVVWESYPQDGSYEGVYAQRYDSAGSPVGSEFQVNTYTSSYQKHPAVAADSPGGFAVVWKSDGPDGSSYGVSGQGFDSTGNKVGSELRINSFTTGGQQRPAVATLGAGRFVVAWQSADQDGSGYGVFGRQLTIPVFADGFELGDACAWSARVGSGASCP